MTERPTSPEATLSSAAYDLLRRQILSGRLEPGQRLTMEFLKSECQVGVTPVREALNRLVSEGLVELEDNRGFRVARVSAGEMRDLFETRCVVENQALRLAMARRRQDWLDAVVLAYHRMRYRPRQDDPGGLSEAWEALHRAFHMALVAGCGLATLTAFCDRLNMRTERYRRLSLLYERGGRDPDREHRAIFDAVMEGDADRAAQELERHYRLTAELLSNGFAAADRRAAPG